MITLHLEAMTVGDLIYQAQRFVTDNTPIIISGSLAEATAEPTPEPEKRKPGRPRKDAPATPPVAEQAPAVQPDKPAHTPVNDAAVAAPATAGVTPEQLRAALQKVAADLGLVKVIAILKEFKYQKVSQVKPEHFADVVKACESAS